jgi:pilus assembly protein CpaE
VYSRSDDPNLLVECMRAGARDLIREPLSEDALTEIVRAVARRGVASRRHADGKTFLFWSAKGGAGASTLAATFAVALAEESGQRVALVDLSSELGDLAVLLNLQPRFSIADALENPDRLDRDFLTGLMVQHVSGVSLLAAPDRYEDRGIQYQPAAIRSMVHLLQEQFPFVVIDAATNGGLPVDVLGEAEAVYLVSQVDIPSLRHAQRLSAHVTDRVNRRDRVHLVLNRYDARRTGIGADEVEKALELPVAWRVPNDFVAVRNSADTGMTSELHESRVGRTVRKMARAACGKTEHVSKKGWKLFG